MCGYINVPVVFNDVKIRHPLLVVAELAFPLLIGKDVLHPNAAVIDIKADTVRLTE